MKNKKVFNKSEFKDAVKGNNVVVKGTTDKIKKVEPEIEQTTQKQFMQKQDDVKGLRNIKDAAKKLDKAGESERAKDLLKKAMQSKAYKRISSSVGKKLLSAIPLIGGVASALQTKDASAAIPLVGDSESLGPRKGSMEEKAENPNTSRKERARIMELMRKKTFGK